MFFTYSEEQEQEQEVEEEKEGEEMSLSLWNKGIQAFSWGTLPTDNWILIFFNYSVGNSIGNI
jgi:hypothetical protein